MPWPKGTPFTSEMIAKRHGRLHRVVEFRRA